jgi:hypothetical protein
VGQGQVRGMVWADGLWAMVQTGYEASLRRVALVTQLLGLAAVVRCHLDFLRVGASQPRAMLKGWSSEAEPALLHPQENRPRF